MQRMWRKGNPWTPQLMGKFHWYYHYQSMEVSLKTENKTIMGSNNPTSEHIPIGSKSLSQRDPWAHVYCSIIHHSQDMKTVSMLLMDEWIKRMWYPVIKKGNPAISNIMDGRLRYCTKWKELAEGKHYLILLHRESLDRLNSYKQ